MLQSQFKIEPPAPDKKAREKVLVVDDSRAQRRILTAYLTRWGFDVIEAGSGEEALAICAAEAPDLIVSDWMMPGMNGLEFCRTFREMRAGRYGYFILLTSKSEKDEVAEGLDVGADDFLSKPVSSTELRARIRAGQRVVAMERQLTEKNRLVTATLAEMQTLYDAVDRDLLEARKLQQSLVRDRELEFPGAHASMLLHPAGRVGGDLVGAFQVNENEIGFYSVDVSGHGVASALITARLAAYFAGNAPGQNIALAASRHGPVLRAPSDVAAALNRRILQEIETEHYLTMLFARLDLRTGLVTMTQAGHPHPVVQRADGSCEILEGGGMPIGLIAGATYTDVEVQLHPGDRLFLCSDGITECTNPDGEMLEQDGLVRMMVDSAGLSGETFFEALLWDLTQYAGDEDFEDDVSGVMLEYRGPDPA